MITANLAGTAGSHLRTDRSHRDSNSHSRHNLHELLECEAAVEAGLLNHEAGDTRTAEGRQAAEQQRLQQLIDQYKRRKFLRDYKTWLYLGCVGIVVVGAIVIVILAATGVITGSN